jgi:hypothetical protein
MNNRNIKWKQPIVSYYPIGKFDAEVKHLNKLNTILFSIQQYFFKIRINFIISIILLIISIVLIVSSKPGSQNYHYGFILGGSVVLIQFGLRVLFNVSLVILSSTSSNNNYELSDKGISINDNENKLNEIKLNEIKRVQMKEMRYLRGSRWFLRVKHINKKWYELEIPYDLRREIEKYFLEHSITFSQSGKPLKGWLY